MQTVSGKRLSVTVGYRLPFPIYRRAIAQAEKRGVKLSVVLRNATKCGLDQVDCSDGRRGEGRPAAAESSR